MTLSRNLSTLGQAVTASGNIPSANLTGTIASAQMSGSYTGITGVGTLSSITFADATVQNSSANTYALGVGQTWQAVTRSNNTTYYNTTSRPIVFRFALTTSGTGQVACTINIGSASFSENFYNNSAGYTWANSYVIPAGMSYLFQIGGGATGTVAGQAYELR